MRLDKVGRASLARPPSPAYGVASRLDAARKAVAPCLPRRFGAVAIAFLVLLSAARADSIVLGGGCFWCMQAAYKLLPGVTNITCGYAGGHVANPSYEDVCTETTGHAEVVKVEYDPAKISLKGILDYFWESHDPTQVGGQGDDMGDSYRSIILYANEAQKAAAEASRSAVAKHYSHPITTEIVPLKAFYPAEDYHQDYFAKHPNQAYCAVVIRPKVKKLKKLLQQQQQAAAAGAK